MWEFEERLMTWKIWHFAYGRQIIHSFMEGRRDLHAQLPRTASTFLGRLLLP